MPVSPEQSRISRQAAEWIVSLTVDDKAEREQARAGFEAWQQEDPRHAAAALRMQAMLGQLDAHEGRPARAALTSAGRASRKRVVARTVTALALAIAVGALSLGVPLTQPSLLLADARTGAGEWQTRILADGSQLTLSSGSAVNIHMSEGQRVVSLLQGEVLVDVARDPSRPFFVQTEDGSIRALGTRFTVERGEHATELAMLESKTEVRAAGRPALATVVVAGEKVRITPDSVGPVAHVDAGSIADAWRDHQLVVQNRPLAEVLDQLARHHRGMIRYDAGQIAAMRVSAVLPLDDTDRALHLLLNSFPALRIRTITPYVVLVDAPAAPSK
ncbi:FecR family protein [Duganella sacchari]|uniref:FecR family protein n=1 Tax=Duganella sacchari TaxID=551987 RepID=A0A1M7KZ17_9BURK|nr:FecR domain-containing protein [Duganella sacchari]SHM70910.1 FecR family protein [Duganella sacchari]